MDNEKIIFESQYKIIGNRIYVNDIALGNITKISQIQYENDIGTTNYQYLFYRKDEQAAAYISKKELSIHQDKIISSSYELK